MIGLFARRLAALALLALMALGGVPVQAQSWPSKPVKVIMATAAGSAPDVIARIVTDRLSQMWGQQVLILNRPGAGGLIALQALAAAERDGHTLYLPSSSSLVVLPVTNSNLPLNIERDLVPIALVGEQPFLIVANNTLGVSTLPEFIARAKSKPKELTYAANFRGSLPNMTGEWFSERAGIELTFVPYPGAPQGLQDVMGGRISAMVEGLAAFVGPMASNAIKPLGITTPKRLPNYPNLPTVAETVPGFDSRGWFVFLGPAGTPDGVVRKVNADVRSVLDVPEVRQRFETLATYIRHLTPEETGKFIRAEQDAWRPVVKKVGVTSP
jgi:tripartite-type tricarboxylate transporter receptor subunit TctC